MSQPFKLFSCDTHLEHPAAAWISYVDPQFRDLVELEPIRLGFNVMPTAGPDGVPLGLMGGFNRFPEVDYGKLNPFDATIPGSFGGPDQYLEWMDMDGVDTAVLLPGNLAGMSIGALYASGNRDAYLNVIRAYNNWTSDFSSAHPGRLLGGACVPLTGVDDAIAEMKRVRALPGIATVSPAAFPNGSSTPLPEDDRFWQAALDMDMPVTFHGGISSPVLGGIKTNWDVAAWIIGHTEVTTGGPFSAAQTILSGVFDRFPQLQICVHECGAGWLPFMMCQMDHMFYRHKWWAGMELKNPPSWYCTSGNLLWNVIADRPAIKQRYEIGVKNLSWSSDFPHSNSQWPWSRPRAVELLAGVPDEERHAILWGNAARFYRVEAGPAPDLRSPADRAAAAAL